MQNFIEVTNALTKRKTLINLSNVVNVDEQEDGTAAIVVRGYKSFFGKDIDIAVPTVDKYTEVAKIADQPASEKGTIRLKRFEIFLKVSDLKVDIETVLKALDVDRGAYILHDKDNSEPHYHIIAFNECGIKVSEIATAFRINENCITKVHGSWEECLNYLIRNLPHVKDGYRYQLSDIHCFYKK